MSTQRHHVPRGILERPPEVEAWPVVPSDEPPQNHNWNGHHELRPFSECGVRENHLRHAILEEKFYVWIGDKLLYRPPQDTTAVIDERATPNNPNKYLVTTFPSYFGVKDEDQLNDRIEAWARAENGWAPGDIPCSPFSNGTLRIQIWKKFLPIPLYHYTEAVKRLPFLLQYPTIKEWFVANARGAMPLSHTTQARGWCKLCGSHFLGYPIENHSYKECPFYQMQPFHILSFMSIQHPAFCFYCGTRTATHTSCSRRTKPMRCATCGSEGHLEVQKLCSVEEANTGRRSPVSPQDQRRLVQEIRTQFYTRTAKLIRDGQLRYPLQQDFPPQYYLGRNEKAQTPLIGWGTYQDADRIFATPRDVWKFYPDRHQYRGLSSPEIDACRTNHIPIFEPAEMDFIEQLADRVDIRRFGEIPSNRPGSDATFVLFRNLGKRQVHRDEMARKAALDQENAKAGFQPGSGSTHRKEENPEQIKEEVPEAPAEAEQAVEKLNIPLTPPAPPAAPPVQVPPPVSGPPYQRTVPKVQSKNRQPKELPASATASTSTSSATQFTPFELRETPSESKWFRSYFQSSMSYLEYEFMEEDLSTQIEEELANGGNAAELFVELGEMPVSDEGESSNMRAHTITRFLIENDGPEYRRRSILDAMAYTYYLSGVSTFMGKARRLRPHFRVFFAFRTEQTVRNQGPILYVPGFEMFHTIGGPNYWIQLAEANWPIYFAWIERNRQ